MIKRKRAEARAVEDMTAEEARTIIIKPYITEKGFNLIESQNTIIFIVGRSSSKRHVKAAIRTLYEAEVAEVNTMNGIRGKKAMVKFAEAEGARNLATTLGLA
jgi:large subunit ribosomal protein L23